MAVLTFDRGVSRAVTQCTGLAVIAAALVLGGCTRSSSPYTSTPLPQQQAAPLEPQPLVPVQEQTLAPAASTQNQQVAVAQPEPEPVPAAPQTPQVDASANAQPVSRKAMIGAWTVSTGGSNCQIFLALTKWSGGYRAASRGCSAAAISDVQAWDVKGKQVVLVDSSGGTAATLFKSGAERYDGSTKGGGAISFTR